MPLVEPKFLIWYLARNHLWSTHKKQTKSVWKICQNVEKNGDTTRILMACVRILMASIYQDKKMQAFLNKLISKENLKTIMVQQCFLSLKTCKKLF